MGVGEEVEKYESNEKGNLNLIRCVMDVARSMLKRCCCSSGRLFVAACLQSVMDVARSMLKRCCCSSGCRLFVAACLQTKLCV